MTKSCTWLQSVFQSDSGCIRYGTSRCSLPCTEAGWAQALNGALQAKLNAQGAPSISRFGSTFAPGDKVIQQVNNYDKEVFNGDVGHIVAIDLEEGSLQVDFEGRSVGYELRELDELSL